MVKRTRFLLLCLFSTVLAGGLASAAGPAPPFELPGRHGTVRLADYAGRIVYVDFWASWCVPCRKSFPWMNAMHRKYEKFGLSIVAVNLDEERALADNFLAQVPAEFVVAFDPSGQTAERYGVKVMPSSYIVGRNGKVVLVHKGFRATETANVEQQIRRLLAQ